MSLSWLSLLPSSPSTPSSSSSSHNRRTKYLLIKYDLKTETKALSNRRLIYYDDRLYFFSYCFSSIDYIELESQTRIQTHAQAHASRQMKLFMCVFLLCVVCLLFHFVSFRFILYCFALFVLYTFVHTVPAGLFLYFSDFSPSICNDDSIRLSGIVVVAYGHV